MATDDVNAFDAVGLDKLLGVKLVTATGDGVTATLEITPDLHQPFGITHGGVYCAIAESAASISGFCWLQEQGLGGVAVGANNSTDFLRSISTGTLQVSTTPVHRGRRQQLWQVDMVDEEGRLVAQSRVRLQNLADPGN